MIERSSETVVQICSSTTNLDDFIAKINGLHRQRVKPDLKPFIVQCIATKAIPALFGLQR